ncbi:MAG: zinc-dependent metalloprotease [Flavobacteriia bacterium]|jgi:PKD repeat protein
MEKTTLILAGSFLLSAFTGLAQRQIDHSNCREGENVEYCITHKKMAELKKDPAFLASWEKDQAKNNEALKAGTEKGFIYQIPVVFHVLHNGGVENISDEQIYDALDILNRDFRLQNNDANNVQIDFVGMPTDAEIEFVLATKAPNGTCFKGITRTMSSLSYNGADGYDQVAAIRNGNDVYQNSWPGDDYLNVFIVGEAGGAAGYTTNPSTWSNNDMTNGIWILHDYVGSIGTSSVGSSRALTHEVGHWLNLDHTWGSNNNPGNASSCSTDDNVTDTPNCIGVTACLLNANTCNSVNSYWSFDVEDNVENYMDYSYCSKMYTAGQVARMRAALEVTSTGRKNLWQPANLTATGATGSLFLCKAEFISNKTAVCVGDSIQFTDDSYNLVSGWTWNFPGGTPATSTDPNPVVIYNTPGVYSVTLTATDGSTQDAETKTNYVRVLPASGTIPFHEGFENYTTLSGLPNWEVYNPNNNAAYAITTTAAHSGSKSVKLANFGQTGSNSDELIASPVDLSSVAANGGVVTLSFRYAYRKRTTADMEFLKVFITSDCGDSWAQRKTLSGSQLSPLAVSTTWTPSSVADWTTVHMINVTTEYWVDNFRYKFEFEGNGGNNFYLDDINIYLGAPSDNIVLGLAENGDIDELSLYPNPADNELNLRFSVNTAQEVVVQIQDVSGKVAETHAIQAAPGSNLVLMDTQKLAAGTYYASIKAGDAQKVLQFVIK